MLLSLVLGAAARSTRGVRRVRRPAAGGSPAMSLAYVRTRPRRPDAPRSAAGQRAGTPVLVIPGGPGLASVLPYRGLRRRARRAGLDVVMVEHRGVGLSRADDRGHDLPPKAMRVEAVVDDLAAALDAEGIDEAVVYGASYGSYLAAAFGARHPERVRAMVLDSPLLSTRDRELERERVRDTLWFGRAPGTTALAHGVRDLVEQGRIRERDVLVVARTAYQIGGPGLAERVVAARRSGHGRLAWWLLLAYQAPADRPSREWPFIFESDLVTELAFRELDWAPEPDGGRLDPAITYASLKEDYADFAGESFDLRAALPAFTWPTAVLTGRHDLLTPPAVAARAAQSIPDSALVVLDNGHSALDSHPAVAVRVMEDLAGRGATGISAVSADAASGAFRRLARRGMTAAVPVLTEAALVVGGGASHDLGELVRAALEWLAPGPIARRARARRG